MSAAYDRISSGYYNPALRSGANPGGLSGVGAMRDNWPLLLADLATVAQEGATSASAAAAAAAAALQAPGTTATSTSEILIPAVVSTIVSFSIQENDRLFFPGQTVLVAAAPPNALNCFIGPLTAFDPVAKTASVKALFTSGAGTWSSWRMGLAAPVDNTLTGRVAALEAANARARANALFIGKEFI